MARAGHIHTHFQRPDRLAAPLDVVLTCFNSARFRTRWKHYEDFVSMAERAGAAVRLWTVEIAFGGRDFAVTERGHKRHLQLRTTHELWHKERSQNLLIRHLLNHEPAAEYFAFIDADVSFIRHDWADETRHALQHYDVVQMWREAYDLDAHGHVVHQHRSFMSCYRSEAEQEKIPPIHDYYHHHHHHHHHRRHYWHPGYCWAWRRSALETVGGLIDWAILGSADYHMACALIGQLEQTLRRKKLSKGYSNAMRLWEMRAERGIRRNVGCVPGSIFHHWHGSKADRRYNSRWKILEQTQFDHRRDLVQDVQGLYQFHHHGHERSHRVRDLSRAYFHARDEDG